MKRGKKKKEQENEDNKSKEDNMYHEKYQLCIALTLLPKKVKFCLLIKKSSVNSDLKLAVNILVSSSIQRSVSLTFQNFHENLCTLRRI